MFEPWQARILDRSSTASLATIAANGEPQVVPVCFVVLGRQFAIAIDEKPKSGDPRQLARLQNIARDPRVTLLVDHYEEDWEQLAWVRVHGTAEVLLAGSDWPEALDALRAKYSQYEAMALESLPLIRIEGARVASWRWKPGD